MKKVFKILSLIILCLAVLFLAFLAYFFVATKDAYLIEDKLTSPKNVCTAYYGDGGLIEVTRNSEYVGIESIPVHVKNAVIAVEDKRFYSHGGIDLRSIARALKNNLSNGKIKEGGSTITQQLIKNTYLSEEKTLTRKMKEVKLALILEKKLSKDEILEKYLNTVYFGENSYGISSAAKNYFGKKVEELSVEEGATLAALLKAPTYYNPFKNYGKAKDRRDLVLSLMQEQNMISEKDLKLLKNKDIHLNFEKNYDYNNITYEEVVSEALDILNLENASDLNGYKIYTSIDKDLNRSLPDLSDYNIPFDYSIIVTENKTSNVLVYKSTVGEIKRIPASTVKPWLIYAPALEENVISEATKILDEKTDFNGYSPDNYGDKYYGYVSVKECLSKSLNVPSVKILNSLGSEKVKEYSKKMGIEFSNDDISISLGNLTGGVTLKSLSDAYSVFSSGGNYSKSRFITHIKNEKGKTVYKSERKQSKVFSDSTAYIINDVLNCCAKEGTAKKLNSLPYFVCAKTGTNGDSNGNKDAYCVAYTKDHTVAVWIGNANGDYMPNEVTGGNYPTAVVKDVLDVLYKSYYPNDFSIPNSVTSVSIDKYAYEKDCKIYLNCGSEKDGISFYFKKGFEPKINADREKQVVIKTLKITCNKRDIEIYSEREDGVEYLVYENGNVIFDSKGNGDFYFKGKENSEYVFYVLPYKEIDGKRYYGEKIKMPSVKTEGKNGILDSPWWED